MQSAAVSDEVILRAYASGDFDWLVDLHGRHYAEAEGFDATFAPLVASILQDFEAQHDPAYERGWVAERNGARLGSIFCVKLDERTAKLRLFILVPEARGIGLGKRMLESCTGFARACRYESMQLWTHESHEAACALYRANGWHCTSSKSVHSFGVDLVEQAWEVTL
ncbi:GNAT family N-acetyltransferase [Marivita sp.]|jgi:GNAT superfamily N-acetyltransferase|uniref:GNAT family N-acetyltransferase n=1 Tax=Marivita sp. TaxID=2003365 RepID=UPI003F6BF38F